VLYFVFTLFELLFLAICVIIISYIYEIAKGE